MTILPNGFAEVSVQLRHASVLRPAFVTWGIDATGVVVEGLAAGQRGAFVAAGSLASRLDSEVTIGPTTVRLGTDVPGEPIVIVDGTTSVGGTAAVSVAANTAVLIRKLSARGGRRGRGRMYMPWWVADADVTEGGVITAAVVTAMGTAANAFLTAVNATGAEMVILHSASLPGTENPTAPGNPTPVTGMSIDGLVATQRRRIGR